MDSPLADLVWSHCERTGDTLAAIAARGGMARQTLSGLVNRDGPLAMPRQQTLEALARGLGLPFETVRRVAAETAYGNPEDEEAPTRRLIRVLIASAEHLTDSELEVLLATTRALRNMSQV